MKFRYLDGLRGVAALVVVIDHFAIAFFQRSTDASIQFSHAWFEEVILQTPLHLLVAGNFAVCIFFVLSGFVLSARFFQTGERKAVVASAWKRYARLELPVLASVLLSYFVITLPLLYNQAAATITGSSWLRDLWTFAPSLGGAIYHATVGIFIEGKSEYNTVLWTMQAELIGSFLVFALLLAVGRWRWRWLVYAGLATLLMHSYLLCFVAGVAICDWYFAYGRTVSLQKRSWVPLVAGSLLLGSIPVGLLQGTVFDVLPAWLASGGMDIPVRMHIAGAIGLVFALVAVPALQRPLDTRPTRYLGQVSFGLYLTHVLVLGTFSSWLFTLLVPALGYVPGFFTMFGLSLLLIWLVAHCFTRWVDEPAIRFSGLLYARFFAGRRKAAQLDPATQPEP